MSITPWDIWLTAVLILALVPLSMTLWNLAVLRRPSDRDIPTKPVSVSVLIPARDEAEGIEDAVRAALASKHVEIEVVVLDDHSTDRTATIVRGLAAEDLRVRLETAPTLPEGWCGKQHACRVLAQRARYDTLAWIDADVRLEPDGIARLLAFKRAGGASLVSAFPWQDTRSWSERLVIPLIPAVLVGYLPITRMRRSTSPSYGAGCGQLFLADREGYESCGGHGHASVQGSLHDGLTLPRAFRRAGRMTDLTDGADLARCRMYRGLGEVWSGLAKNATEGMASPGGIGVWTALLLGGWVLPWVNLIWWAIAGAPGGLPAIAAIGGAVAAAITSFVLQQRFAQPWLAAVGRPVGVTLLVAVQWYALGRAVLGKPATWRGRSAPARRVAEAAAGDVSGEAAQSRRRND